MKRNRRYKIVVCSDQPFMIIDCPNQGAALEIEDRLGYESGIKFRNETDEYALIKEFCLCGKTQYPFEILESA